MSQRILILDDDTDLLEVISMLLQDSGYETMALSSGQKVVECINQFQPDLLLMDIMLGNMDGRIICKHLKEHTGTKELPVILISGTNNLSKTLQLQGPPNDYLAKPFDLDFLLKKIERLLLS